MPTHDDGTHVIPDERTAVDDRALALIRRAMLEGAVEIIARRLHGGSYDVLILSRPTME